jgi:hypothetical protein
LLKQVFSPTCLRRIGLIDPARESMSHELELFVGKRAILERLRTRWPDAQLYQPTPKAKFAVLPIRDWEAFD